MWKLKCNYLFLVIIMCGRKHLLHSLNVSYDTKQIAKSLWLFNSRSSQHCRGKCTSLQSRHKGFDNFMSTLFDPMRERRINCSINKRLLPEFQR
uniref:Putative secreted protein n=1 Tax=Ixodes ricinus TaxID=34613 RepID=A0A6B0U8W1_IXORI